MTSLADKILRRVATVVAPSIPLAAYPFLLPRPVTGFFYHVVSDEYLPHVTHLYPYKNAAAFEQDLQAFSRRFTPVSYEQILNYVTHGPGRAPLPPKAAFISFDDGFRECYTVVRPLLLKYHVPAIFFVTTDAVDNRLLVYNNKVSLCIEALLGLSDAPSEPILHAIREKTRFGQGEKSQEEGTEQAQGTPAKPGPWDALIHWLRGLTHQDEGQVDAVGAILGLDFAQFLQDRQPYLSLPEIQQMHAEGFTFGAHTRQHTKLMHLSPAEQAAEIVASCQVVAGWVGERSVPFAFPFSGAYVNREFLRTLRREQPVVGLYFDTNHLRQDRLESLQSRIWLDKPVPGVPPEKNLEYTLHQAYQWTLVDRFSSREY